MPFLEIVPVRLGNSRPGDGGGFVGHTQNGEAIGPVGGDLDVEDCVTQVVHQWGTNRGVVVQDQDSLVVLSQPQLQFRADHAAGEHTPDPGRFQLFHLVGPGTEKPRPLPGERDLLSRTHVGRATHHGCGLTVSQVDRGECKAVGVGVPVDLEDAPDKDFIPVPLSPDLPDLADLASGHGQAVGQLLRRYGYGYVILEP